MAKKMRPAARDEELDEILWELEAELPEEAEEDGSFSRSPSGFEVDGAEVPGSGKRNKKDEKPHSLLLEILDFILTLAVVAGAVFLLNTFILINARIPSESMEPTIQKGNQIFGNRLSYISKGPGRFDIIIFRYPDDETEYFIKRVIGMPGETVLIEDGKVYINGDPTPLDDSYVAEPWGFYDAPMEFEVPEDSYFVMGDNRNHSNDSRYWHNHFVHRDKILGKAVLRYWPVWKMKIFRYTPPEAEE